MRIEDLLAAIASLLVAASTTCCEPQRGGCPAGWHHDGVRRDGRYECVRAPIGSMDDDGTWGRPDRSRVPPGIVRSRIYCTGGAVPIVVSERVVGCQRVY